ncbi:MAG: biopolymer transporter ExbD [Elusimicrobia bacterium]|nr:biopolymer transporter ExbD [Elusimicrobiota bacterium]
MRKVRSFSDSAISGVNIVPVIDLCLVLLVILLIISPMLDAPPVEVKLPTAKTKEEKENNISITVAPNGKMALNTETIDSKELPKLLNMLIREQGDDVLVIIRADKDVQYGQLTDILKTAKTSGAKRISLGTEKPKEDK